MATEVGMTANLKDLIAKRLRAARQEAGLTQSEVADILGITRVSYSHIETGRNSLPLEHLVRLPEVLHKSVNYFLDMGTTDMTPDEVELLNYYREISIRPRKKVLLLVEELARMIKELEVKE